MRARPGTVRKIWQSHYAIVGVACRCGGEIQAQRVPHEQPWLAWEMFCADCLACDPNGYATLRECVEAAKAFVGGKGT